MAQNKIRLGVNIDHVATIRNARGGIHPDPVKAALIAVEAGADGITAHLREDRRHISDRDIDMLMAKLEVPLNLEMAATDEMLAIAVKHKPASACIVPEKRQELTTEGGLDVVGGYDHLAPFVEQLRTADISVSLFIDPDEAQIMASKKIGADKVELHTGLYAEHTGAARAAELDRLRRCAALCESLALEVHAGHGLNYDTIEDISTITPFTEFNIGHFLIGEAIFIGLPRSIAEMKRLMDQGRARAGQ
ncbi:pyridoxine 5'-phosphate synthase [Paremcibacter congregatus]|uniref:Pyridoxine 5'-phosphate synthase n=1 Tax=Paremcibacter congregatus TaxID=2043170 RepID=A0A2G4YND2_9PROT|nr:pyridoxine 5'-phosphate synthase [Paremcibacter congregatus]PHZ83807.1 pyridoxine 5'-phosphate synthase [Paremcibacter congregatus]QDE27510.1 pyridoxine 5'-phosphate synthase [Paremcibacter congregatus]